MTLCYPKVSTAFYNSVPFLEDAVTEFEEKKVNSVIAELGSIFVKHNVWDKFAVCMVHKHFNIDEGEILVEVESEDKDLLKTVALPWVVVKGMGNILLRCSRDIK